MILEWSTPFQLTQNNVWLYIQSKKKYINYFPHIWNTYHVSFTYHKDTSSQYQQFLLLFKFSIDRAAIHITIKSLITIKKKILIFVALRVENHSIWKSSLASNIQSNHFIKTYRLTFNQSWQLLFFSSKRILHRIFTNQLRIIRFSLSLWCDTFINICCLAYTRKFTCF